MKVNEKQYDRLCRIMRQYKIIGLFDGVSLARVSDGPVEVWTKPNHKGIMIHVGVDGRSHS